ncbi:MAG: DUF4388 domain-containing protein [Thermoleophilia bacterium]
MSILGLSGDLRDFGLSEVLQILVMGRKTGVLELAEAGNGVHGKVWLVQGRVVHATRNGDLEGVAALLEMLHQAEGRFSFEASSVPETEGPVTINRTLDGLLLEASMGTLE